MLVSEGPSPEFQLAGYLSAVTGKPGFAVPVFRGPSSNRPMVQLISEQDLVAGFRELADGRHVRDHPDAAIRITEGAPALWAFVGEDGRLRVQPRAMLVETLEAELQDGTEPFLQLQIAQFCGLEQQFSAKWKAVFRHIDRTSPRSAAAWRDVVIVPAGVRAAVLGAAKTHGLAIGEQDLRRAVTAIVERKRLVISLEPALYEAFSTHPGATKALKAGTLALREAFSLRADSVVTAYSAVERRDEIFNHRSRFIAVGDTAVRIARHAISNERSFNGSVRRIGRPQREEPPIVGVVHGSEMELHTGDEWPRVKLDEDGTLLILVGISPGDQQPVHLARHIAEAHRGRGRRIVGVVPHLPGDLATEGEIDLWRELAHGCDALWGLSDISPHTRQNLSYGGGHSLAAASGRVQELLALADRSDFPLVQRPQRERAEICVIGSATGGLSPRGLLEHAAMRVSTPSVLLEEARMVLAGVGGARPSDDWLAGTLGEIASAVPVQGVDLPEALGNRLGLLAFIGAELRPVNRRAFERHCVRELRMVGWNVHSDRTDNMSVADSEEGSWRVVAAPGELVSADELTEGWREDRREIRFSERTVGRRDFLIGVLLGSVPVNPNRIPVLAKILRGRWKTAVSIAQDRRTDVIGALFHATRARILRQVDPDRAWNPAEFELTARPEVRPLGNAVQASFPFALSAGEHRVARVLLNPDGFEVALDE